MRSESLKSIMITALSMSLATTLLISQPDSAGGKETNESSTKKAIHKSYKIEIEGLKSLDPDEVYSILGVPLKSWFQFWESDEKRIDASLLPSIADTLRGYLDSKGYYDATFKIEKKGELVVVKIDEKSPVKIEKIEIESDFPIRELISFHKGEAFETERFSDIKSAIKTELLKKGYCSYDLDTKAYVDLDKKSVELKYRLKKGDLCRFGDTKIVKKPADIPEEVLLSRVRYSKGEIFTTEKINNTYSAINELGAFGEVLIDTDKKIFNVVPPEISARLREKLHRYTLAGGYDSVVGARVKATYRHYNFFGGARKFEATAEYSSELKKVELNFFQPALMGWNMKYFDLFAKAGYFQEEYDTYDEENAYANIRLRHMSGDLTFDVGMALENIDIVKTARDDSIIGGSFLMFYPYMEVVYDGRDSKLDPKNGYFLSLYAEYGLPFDPEASNYLKALIEARVIHTFGRLTLAGVGKVGSIDDSAGVLPASKYFYAGGAYSNRAYGERDIGMTVSSTEDDSLGGRTWLNFSAEADYPIIDKLSGAIFYDATMIAEGTYDFSAPWIQSAGVGFRYATPMGPVKLDFAANIHSFSTNRISFMVGQSF
jgi:translocation and assembly module TamA